MSGKRFPLPSRAILVALAALFVALGGTAYSATNGSFILGTPNSATSTSALTANLAGKALVVSNPSTATGAAPLGLTAGAGRPPFTTNSSTKVANLNADKLDGIDSTGFAQAANTQILTDRKVTVPGNIVTVLSIPDFGVIKGECFTNAAQAVFSNTSGGNIDLWIQDTTRGGVQVGRVFANGDATQITLSGSAGADGTGELGLGVGNDPGPRSVAVIHAYAFQSADNAPCGFQAQATIWHS